MPKQAINYQNTIIYKLVCKDLNVKDLYVGHTTNFKQRKQHHKSSCNNTESKKHNLRVYDFIRQNGGWNNWEMIEVEKYPCKDMFEATKQERYWYEELKANLNSQSPQTSKQEREDITNKKKREKYNSNEEYRKKRLEKDKLRYDKIKNIKQQKASERVNCECCGKELRRDSLWRHRNSCPSRPKTE